MSPKTLAVAGLSALALTAGGCSGDSDPEAEFRAAFEKEFSAAPWYHHITGMEVAVADGSGQAHIELTTDLGSEDGQPDRGFCGEVRDFAFDSFDEVLVGVIGSDGVERGGCG